MKKLQSNTIDNNNDDITVEAPELETIFNFHKEEACFKGQYADEKKNLNIKDGSLLNKLAGKTGEKRL